MYVQKTVHAMQNGGLYVVATPIGNLNDMTYRAVEVLKAATCILAEDTRVTRKLCQYFDITTPIISCNEHNQYDRIAEVVARIESGEQLALVSDAGMPCVSDPGSIIVEALIKAQLPISVIPGASAGVSLYSVSGMSGNGKFTFHGFLPTSANARAQQLQQYLISDHPVIFYESPHRIKKTLLDVKQLFPGTSQIALARELTKLYETLVWLDVSELDEGMLDSVTTWKGEIAFALNPGTPPKVSVTLDEACVLIAQQIASGMKSKAAIKMVSQTYELDAGALYRAWVAHKEALYDT